MKWARERALIIQLKNIQYYLSPGCFAFPSTRLVERAATRWIDNCRSAMQRNEIGSQARQRGTEKVISCALVEISSNKLFKLIISRGARAARRIIAVKRRKIQRKMFVYSTRIASLFTALAAVSLTSNSCPLPCAVVTTVALPAADIYVWGVNMLFHSLLRSRRAIVLRAMDRSAFEPLKMLNRESLPNEPLFSFSSHADCLCWLQKGISK